MQAINDSAARYDSTTIWLHWITALLVLVLWCLGETMDWFPRGDARIVARSVHVLLGTTLALILCWRIVWRIKHGRRLPTAEYGRLQVLAKLIHFALYVLIAATVLIGLTYTWVRGDNIFNLFRIPALHTGIGGLRSQLGYLHELAANAVLILAGAHAVAGLWHYFVRRDQVMWRMGVKR